MSPTRTPIPILVLVAVALTLTLSANLFTAAGIPYAAPGGNPLEKFHPATWCLGIALALACMRELSFLARAPRDLVASATLMIATMLFSVASVGPSGAAVYVESFLAPIALAFLLHRLDDAARRRTARLALALILANVAIAFGETAAHAHLVPIYLEDRILVDPPGEFRSAALFDHPLTAAMATMTALLSLPALGLKRRTTFALGLAFGLGLLAFGGRAALLATACACGGAVALVLVRRALARRLDPATLALAALGAVALPVALATILATTSLGERLAAHLTVDASAQSRATEWMLIGQLDLRSLLFGTPISVTPGLIYRLGLTYPFTDIENFWLMAFLDLGIFGFILYASSLVLLFRHLWRQASHPMIRVAILCLVLVASSSNSLGRKCNVLTVLVVFACAAPVRMPLRRSSKPPIRAWQVPAHA